MKPSTLLLFVLLASAPCVALGAPPETERLEARERFDRGLRLFDQGDDDGALVEFQRAYDIVPHPLVLYNIGLVRVALGQFVDAVRALDQVLREPGSLSPAQLAHARETRARAAARIGKLEVRVEQRGARIELDGIDVGVAPLSAPLQVASGTHTVTVVARGHHPSHRRVSVAGGRTEIVNVMLEPLEGQLASLTLKSRVPSAEVLVDGKPLGETPLAAPLSLAPGRHDVELRRAGYRTAKKTVTLGDGASVEIELHPELDRSALSRTGGVLELRLREENAVAFVNDQPMRGHSLRLPGGRHHLRVERDGFFAFEREVEVVPGKTSTILVELEPSPEFRANYRDSAKSQRFWSWVTIGGGAVVAASGAGFLIWNQVQHDDAQEAFDREAPRHEQGQPCWPGSPGPRPDDCKDLNSLIDRIDTANSRYPIGWAMVGVGAAALGAGTFFLLTSDDPDRYEPSDDSDIFGRVRIAPAPVVSTDGASVGIVGVF